MSALKVCLIAAAVCPLSLAVDCDDCAQGEDQTSLLQVHSEFSLGSERAERAQPVSSMISRRMSDAAHDKSPNQGCTTPTGARWCEVRMPGMAPYNMAVYSGNCIISNEICRTGRWEDLDLPSLGSAGEALDIGGNIGFFSVALAKAGWNVTTFEPMPQNVELLKATICENPEVASKIKLFNIGLGEKPDECQVMSDGINQGDGVTHCGSDAQTPVPAGYVVRGSFPVRRLDDVLAEQKVANVDFVKIDVETFECRVFNGAPEFLTKYRPRLIHTEVMSNIQGCAPSEYLNKFSSKGYKINKDVGCQIADPVPPKAVNGVDEIKNYWVCKDASLLQLDAARSFHKRRVLLQLA